MNLPNKISVFRVLLIPFFILSIFYYKWGIALIVFVVAALSDAVDGYLARRQNEVTALGEALDPLADKLLVISAFVCLSLVSGLPDFVRPPLYVAVIIISRDIILLLGSLLIYLMRGKLRIQPTRLGKWTTFFQMATVISILLRFKVSPLLWSITVAITVVSGADYMIRGSKLLNGKA